MFTGLVEEMGTIRSIKRGAESAELCIEAFIVTEDAKIGDSIAVNGTCLTVTRLGDHCFYAHMMHETLDRSSLRNIAPKDKVNLERAMRLGDRFGGHIVSGHIDGTGEILAVTKDDTAIWYRIGASEQILRYVVEKGSITIDGISLTVAKRDETSFSVSVIPHTAEVTILGKKKSGDIVNLENDVVGKYVEQLMTPYTGSAGAAGATGNQQSKSNITMEFLMENGF